MRFLLRIFVAVGLLLAASSAQADEFRGIFADAFHPGYKNHEEVVQMVNAAKAANLNALIVQVRRRGDVYYNSAIEPKAADIAADYDALADVVAQAHAARLKVYAWISVYPVAVDSPWAKSTLNHVHITHPEWLMSDKEGETVIGGKVYLDPGVPAVQDHLVSIAREIATNYSVDGLHLDGLGYPSYLCGYNRTSVERYNLSVGKSEPPKGPESAWRDWRCNEITILIRRIKREVAAVKPGATISASVLHAEPMVARMTFLQDWGRWTDEGHLDFVIPLLFSKGHSIHNDANKAVTKAANRHAYMCVGAWQVPTETAESQIRSCRQAGSQGVVLYSYHYLGPQSTASCARLSDLASLVFSEPASPPVLSWRE